MAIHTFGDYLDFHPHLHALVTDGLFVQGGLFHVMPQVSLKPLEKMFQAKTEHTPRRIPSIKWRELIKKVWEATRGNPRDVRARCG